MKAGDFRTVFLPYCIHRQADGRYAVLNRGYKPLGFHTRDHVRYEDYPICVELPGLSAELAAQLSIRGDRALDRIYLYDDRSLPTRSAAAMRAYLGRLRLLASLEVDA